jgi:aldehyde:ferredoxin oxidoreductase
LSAVGYNGRILHVDLDALSFEIEEPDANFWRLYGGGGLLATYYLLKMTPPGLDAFDPRSLLIFTSSVVAGQPYAGLARFTVAGKSPLTGGIGEARCEGPFGAWLKRSGFDTIIVKGAAKRPTRVSITDGVVSFHNASDLWGRKVQATVDALEAQILGEFASAVIGPAGENRVRFASVISERSYQASRAGMGAVMGSKLLKAITISGGALPPTSDPARCKAMTASYAERMRKNPLTLWQLEPPGFSAWVQLHGLDAALCSYNYRDSEFVGADNYAPDRFMEFFRHDGVCPGCPNACIKFFGSNDRAYDARAGAIHQEITGALGPNLGNADLEVLIKANILCNEYGVDPDSLGYTLSMAMECVDRGLITEDEIGLSLRFDNADSVLQIIPQIATRKGFGAVLAEGAKRAAEKIGNGAERYAMHVKGLEMVPFEPRSQTNLGLGYAVAAVGPRYEICEHDWDFDTRVGWPHTLDSSRTIGITERIGMGYVGPEKVRNFKALNTLWSAADTLDFSLFAVAPTRVFTLHEMAELLAAVTGWNTSSYEIMRYGERRNHLMRVYNLREGLSAADDRLPDRFYDDAIPQGSWKGHSLDRATFEECIRVYYRMMGWDDQGRPLEETLIDHNVAWAFETTLTGTDEADRARHPSA